MNNIKCLQIFKSGHKGTWETFKTNNILYCFGIGDILINYKHLKMVFQSITYSNLLGSLFETPGDKGSSFYLPFEVCTLQCVHEARVLSSSLHVSETEQNDFQFHSPKCPYHFE
jgi:hypothetical protein